MKTSETGIDLIKHYECLQLQPYICPAGKPTIGYGHTGPDVVFGITITEADADKLLREDLHFAERGVETYTHVPLTQGQFDALVSFAYNLGTGSISGASGFETVNRAIRAGKPNEIANAMTLYVYGGSQRLPGLVRRRNAEARLIKTGNYSTEFP